MGILLSLLLLILLSSGAIAQAPPTPEQMAIPPLAQSDPVYALGYLKCTYYSGVANNETGNSTTGLQNCINDAWVNALTVFLPCGTYLINDTLRMYEWQNWSGSAAQNPDPRNYVMVGSQSGGCKPIIKLIASSSGFTTPGTPRPMLAVRNFMALNSGAASNCTPTSTTPGCFPTNPLSAPANFRDLGSNLYQCVVRNIEFHTNGNAGAIGLTFAGAQMNFIADVKVTATGSYAGIYGTPGRNAPMMNIEVIGGQYGIIAGPIFGLGLDNTNGSALYGITLTNQTVMALRVNDSVPLTVAGLTVTASSNNVGVYIDSPAVIYDAKITLSGAAANDIAIDNPNTQNLYLRNVYVSGTNQLVRNGTTVVPGSGTWARLFEYAYNDPFQKDSSIDPTVYPTYGLAESHFEMRSVIDGQLSQGSVPVSKLTNNASAPPSDLISRHVTTLPSFEDGTYIVPACTATVVTPGYGQAGDDGNTGQDCTAAINTAIADAATATHNRVHLPRGVVAVSGSINLKPNTKLMGAGPGLNSTIAYKSTWLPTTETYFLTTDSNATSTAFAGGFTLYARTNPFANQFVSFLHWRLGAGSATWGIGYDRQHSAPNVDNQPLKLIRFSGNGGGKHYGNHPFIEALDSNAGVRVIYVDQTTQPLTFYGQNLEITKNSATVAAFSDANMEISGASNVRVFGCKREGESPTVKIANATNIFVGGCGAMSLPTKSVKGAYVQVTGTSDKVLVAVQEVRDNKASAVEYMLREAITGKTAFSAVPWPNGISYYSRGQFDDAAFGAVASTAPEYFSATVSDGVPDQLTVCWTIYDATAMLPASATTGWTVTVDGVSKSVTTSARVGLNCYQLNFATFTITTGTQAVVVSYTPGNITAGGTGTPPALAFSNKTAENLLSPTPNPVYTQAGFAFRQIYGDETPAESPYYANEASTYENINARFIQGASFRLRFKIVNTIAAAGVQPFYVCVSENGGAFELVTDSCATKNTCFANAPDLGDGSPTTEQLTEIQSTFVPGGLLESSTVQVPVTLPQNSETEYEAAIKFKIDVPINNTYDYQMCRVGGAALNVYTVTPRVTVITKRSAQVGGGVRR